MHLLHHDASASFDAFDLGVILAIVAAFAVVGYAAFRILRRRLQ